MGLIAEIGGRIPGEQNEQDKDHHKLYQQQSAIRHDGPLAQSSQLQTSPVSFIYSGHLQDSRRICFESIQ
jgi:hypothetical protein